MIAIKDISVVVQGRTHPELTPRCLASVREHLPEAQLILSAWRGADLTGFDYDMLVETDDPGGFKDETGSNFTNNMHRQVVSSANGLKKASTRYALKLRGDVELKSKAFLSFWGSNPERIESCRLFEHKIICSDYFFKKFLGVMQSMPVPFHVGDWVQFGLTSDLLRLWDINLPKEPDFTTYFADKHSNSTKRKLKLHGLHAQFAPEQYQLLTACRMNGIEVEMDDLTDYNSQNIQLYERVVANNFIIISPRKWVFRPLKHPYNIWFEKGLPLDFTLGLYSEKVLQRDYEKYILQK